MTDIDAELKAIAREQVETFAKKRDDRLAAEQRLLDRQKHGELVWQGARGACWHRHMYRYRFEHEVECAPCDGRCSWCGGETKGKRRWHPECVDEYRLIHWWNDTTNLLSRRRTCHVCADCGEYKPVEWDHIRPLAEAGEDVTAHFLDNIQPLCHECHAVKTADQAARRKVCKLSQPLFAEFNQNARTPPG